MGRGMGDKVSPAAQNANIQTLSSDILSIHESSLERVGRVCQNLGGEIHGSGK